MTDARTLPRLRTRLAWVGAIVAIAFAPAASAAPGLLVGITDNAFLTDPGPTLSDARALGVNAIHVFLTWQPDQTSLALSDLTQLNALTAAAAGIRIVVTVDGDAADAPTTPVSRSGYCAFVLSLAAHYPQINDIVIWNEPNQDASWQPQYSPDGTPAAPAAYETLLAQCWDQLHALRPTINVIMSTSPRGNNNPHAATDISIAPATFIQDMGAAYRASGRTSPIFDTVGHNAYPTNSAEPPSQQHQGNEIGQGDLPRLLTALNQAFNGTAQPTPGHCESAPECPSVWYLEDGFQTTPDPAHAGLYSGIETDTHPLPDTPPPGDPTAPTQSSQLTAALDLAYCQPSVGAYFNFLLQDQPDLAGWQSGLLWANGTPKAAYTAYQQAITNIHTGTSTCTQT